MLYWAHISLSIICPIMCYQCPNFFRFQATSSGLVYALPHRMTSPRRPYPDALQPNRSNKAKTPEEMVNMKK